MASDSSFSPLPFDLLGLELPVVFHDCSCFQFSRVLLASVETFHLNAKHRQAGVHIVNALTAMQVGGVACSSRVDFDVVRALIRSVSRSEFEQNVGISVSVMRLLGEADDVVLDGATGLLLGIVARGFMYLRTNLAQYRSILNSAPRVDFTFDSFLRQAVYEFISLPVCN